MRAARPPTGIDGVELLVATKGIMDGATRVAKGAAPAGARENPWGHNVVASSVLSLTRIRQERSVRRGCADGGQGPSGPSGAAGGDLLLKSVMRRNVHTCVLTKNSSAGAGRRDSQPGAELRAFASMPRGR